MRPPGGSGRRGCHTAATATPGVSRHQATDANQNSSASVAEGELFEPFGRRRMWSIIVRRCPACAHMHVHKTGDPTKGHYLRTGSCGAEYLIRPVARLAVAG